MWRTRNNLLVCGLLVVNVRLTGFIIFLNIRFREGDAHEEGGDFMQESRCDFNPGLCLYAAVAAVI